MRPLVLFAILGLSAPLRAETSYIGSSGIGVGVIGSSPASVFDVGLDCQGDDLQLGVGARVAVLTDGSIREQDWDEPSEWATVLRYLVYRKPATSSTAGYSLAAGELGDAEQGRGLLITGYESAIDIDHRHLGFQARYAGRRLEASTVVDDVASPRIVGVAGSYRFLEHLAFGAELLSDLSAPTMSSAESVFGASGSVALSTTSSRGGGASIYLAGAGWRGLGAGGHLGAQGTFGRRDGLRVSLRAEGYLASDRYIAGYVGTFYERNRRQFSGEQTQLDRARAGGLQGMGTRIFARAERAGLGSVALGWERRPSLGSQLSARLLAADQHAFQLGAHAAASELGAGERVWLLAAEARGRLPSRFFAQGQLARLFREIDGSIEPAWWLIASIGAVVGE